MDDMVVIEYNGQVFSFEMPKAAHRLTDVATAAHKLDVRPATVKAYMRSGKLTKHRAYGVKGYLLDLDEVESLAAQR